MYSTPLRVIANPCAHRRLRPPPSAFPLRGRCPEGADEVSLPPCSPPAPLRVIANQCAHCRGNPSSPHAPHTRRILSAAVQLSNQSLPLHLLLLYYSVHTHLTSFFVYFFLKSRGKKRLSFIKRYGRIKMPHNRIYLEHAQRMCYCLLVKKHSPFWHSLCMSKIVWQQTEMRFSCAAPFGAAHFLL